MKFLKDNGLTIVLVVLSITTIGGMLLTYWSVYNHELAEHGAAQIGLGAYASSGHFLSSLFEMGIRIPADVGIRYADSVPVSVGVGRIQESG